MSIAQRTVTGLLWTALDKWGGKVGSFLTFMVLARLLSPEAFGVIALALAFVAFARVFLDKGFTDAIIQKEYIDDLHVHSAFWVNLLISLFLVLVTFFSSEWIAALFSEPDLSGVVRWMSVIFVIRAFNSVQEALFRRNVKFKTVSAAGLSRVFVGASVGIPMAYFGYGVWSLVAQQIANQTTYVLVLWRVSSWRPAFRFSFPHARELMSFGIGVIGSGMLSFVNRRMDDILVGAFLGSTALGYYNVAYKILLSLVQVISSVGSRVMFPVFSRLQGSDSKTRSAYYKSVGYTLTLSSPVYLGLLVLAPYAIPIFFGEGWSKSVHIMQILCLVGLLQSGLYFNSPIILSRGSSILNMSISLVRATLNVIGFWVAVTFGGVVEVAIAYTTVGYVVAPIEIFVIKRMINIEWERYLYCIAKPVIAAAISAATVQIAIYTVGSRIEVLSILILGSVAGAIIFCGVILVINPGIYGELRQIYKTALAGTS